MAATENFALPLPQMGEPADIRVLNRGTEEIDGIMQGNRTMIAPAFDNTKAYVTGDPVEYLGALYVFVEDKAAGAWDASKVEPTTAAEMGGGGASALADLDDVEITSPTDGQALVYDDTDDVWKNATLPEPSVTKTATGNPIEITDAAAAPMVKCVTQITGYQSGTGTPSPDNIRPITAYTEGEIEVVGKNLGYLANDNIASKQNCTLTYSGKNGVTLTKTANYGRCRWEYKTVVGKKYTVSFDGYSGGNYKRVYLGASLTGWIASDGAEYALINLTSSNDHYKYTFTATSNTLYVGLYPDTNVNADVSMVVSNFMIEEGSSATDYEPYISTTHTTTYPSAIFRGSEDVVNGSAVTEWGMIASYAGETLPGEWISDRDEYAPGTTPTTGAQVAYALAAPTTSSITPTNLPIKSLFGYNHIESSTGEMEIEYITEGEQPIIDLIEKSSHIYSTQEQVVGTWIDGKTLYEKTIKKQNISSVSTSTVLIPSSELTGMDIVEIGGSYISTTTASTYPINAYVNSNTIIATWLAEGDIYYWLYWGAADTYDAYITIRYTKSSSNRSLSAPVTSQKSISEPLTDKTEEVPTEEEKAVEKPETEEETNETER